MDTTTAKVLSVVKNVTETARDVSFSWYDYTLFTMMLLMSALIGIYFGCFGKKQDSTNEYLLGGKNMGIFPISMSLISSLISGITLLAVPADIYAYGIQYLLCMVSFMVVSFVTLTVFLPVFYKLEITSTFEYLQFRFNKKLRSFASLMFTIHMFLYLPIVIFIPALAFSQATGFNIHLITPLVCFVCIFYTTLGGLKAVVWTDALQFTAMIGAVFAVVYIGTSNLGGLGEVLKHSLEGGRLDIDFDISPLKRESFWCVFLGATMGWMAIGVSQGPVQKFMALGSMKNTKITMIIFVVGMVVVVSSSVYTGLLIYATYRDCDLLKSNKIEKPDQLLPYYVLDIAADIPGLSGLFIAGLFSAALSTLSASMNSLAGTIFEDFVSPFFPKTTSPSTIGHILKWIVVIIGIVCTALVFVVENLGGLLPLAISFGSITNGPLTGLFMLGMLVPSVNSKGAMAGCMTSLVTLIWIVFGAQYYKASGQIVYPTKPMSIDGCDFLVNNTISFANFTITNEEVDEPFFAYRISYYYYTLIGVFLVFIVAIPVSYMTRKKDDIAVNKDYISPVMHWLLEDEKKLEYIAVSQNPTENNKNNFS